MTGKPKTSSRVRFNRSLFTTAPGRPATDLVALLEAEDIELLIDARTVGADREELAAACQDAETYFAVRPELAALGQQPSAEPDRAHGWAAHMALRHRTCLLGDPGVAQAVAALVGMRVIDLDLAPARIAFER